MRLLTYFLVSATLVSVPALADAHNSAIYPAAFYQSIEPQTALDMVRRTPGFNLQAGDNRRGYAGSLGNVLIDGRRPIAKNQTLEEALQLIPASQVLRIELLSAADVAGDPSGFAVIANIVRVTATGQGIWGAGAEYGNRDRPAGNGFVNWSGRLHDTNYSIGGQTYSLVRDLPGRYLETDAFGTPTGSSTERSPRTYYEYAVNGSAGQPLLGGALSLTSKLKYSRYHEHTDRAYISAAGASAGGAFTPYTETTQSAEIGGQFDRDLGPWKLTAIGLFTRTHFFSDVSSTARSSGDRFAQSLNHQSAENIVRGSLARSFGSHRLEFGYERASNSLEAALNLTFTTSGTTFPITVPDGNSTIEEGRDELYVADLWQLTSDLTTEIRLGYERPVLEFSGDTEKRVAYGFTKPSVTVTRKLGRNQINFRVYRDIGQIDFNDFVSAASLKDAVINGGNPDLRPQTQWRAEFGGDFHFGARMTLSAKVYHADLQDTADLIPVVKDGQAYDAPGNIGDGTIDGITLSLFLPLDRLLPGATVQGDFMRQRTRVMDPLTNRSRIISNLPTATSAVSFRQDLKGRHLAWGIDYSGVSAATKYRFNEEDTTQESPKLDVYLERNNLGPYTLKAVMHTDGDRDAERTRVFFAPDRRGAISRREAQSRNTGTWFNLSLSRLF